LAAALFPCQTIQFLIKYLGIPLSVTKLPRSALHPLLDRVVEKLLVWKGRLMHHSGQLALVKFALMAIPIYTSIRVGLPTWLLQALQGIMKVFLWTRTDTVQHGKCLVAWNHVQWPLHLGGGLGVMDL
jgi:hypothetical protein